MSKVWVQAVTRYNLIENGMSIPKHPGDWFELGKHDARNAQAAGQIIIHNPVYRNAIIPPESGIVLREKTAFTYENLPVMVGEISLPYNKTMLWHPDFKIDRVLIPVGLSLLERWEIAVPISDYNLLARDIGTDEERRQTAEVIPDLRVPVYDTRLIFARRCVAIEQLFELWLNDTGDERLSFLRSLYRIKPYILALPSIWLRK
jgi:hypothetical protein